MRVRYIVPIPLLFLLILGPLFFQKGEVRIEHELPERIAPGEELEVSIRVHKGDREQFAKLELELPKGLEVEAVEKSGASFSSKDGTAKFLWMAMPKGGQFLVKYRLKANKGIEEGERTIRGEFRYLEGNKRKKVSLRDKTILVQKSDGTSVSDEEGQEGKEQEKGDSSKTARDEEGVKVDRSIEKVEDRGFRVEARIQKGDLEDFAKLLDSIPEGFQAVPIKEKGSSFTFEGRKAKFVWMSMPRKSTLSVSYRLIPEEAEPGTYRLPGSLSYLKDGSTVVEELDTLEFQVKDPKKTADASSGEGEKGKEEKKEEGAKSSTEDSLTGDVPDPQKGIDFRVQICAGHKDVPQDHFKEVYGYQGDYDIDQHKGWLKYLTGKFDAYKKARDKRVYFRKNFELPGPFVTAYNHGERITVQEALMITDQEWVQ